MFCVLAWKSFQRNKNFWSLKDARGSYHPIFCSYQGMSFSPLTLFQSLIFPFPLRRIYHENNFDCVCKFWNCNHSPRSFVFLIDFFFPVFPLILRQPLVFRILLFLCLHLFIYFLNFLMFLMCSELHTTSAYPWLNHLKFYCLVLW